MSYFDPIINPSTAEDTIRGIAKAIEDSGLHPNFIAVRGASGIAAASALAIFAHLPIVIVRKAHDESHGGEYEKSESDIIVGPYVVVDDGVSTGRTIEAIKHRVYLHSNGSRLVGVFVYNQDRIGDYGGTAHHAKLMRDLANVDCLLYDTKTGKSF